MAMCGKCQTEMKQDGLFMVCPACTHHYQVPEVLPSYEQLLKENKLLREYIIELNKLRIDAP